jgi:polar amino acid transport system substrate-binding protein
MMKAMLATLLCATCMHAVAQKAHFVIGVENIDYYPLHTSARAPGYSGFARDVLDAFAQQHGYVFTYVPLPIQRLLITFLNDATLDFKYPDNPSWQPALRQQVAIRYSMPLVSSEEGALVLPARKGRPLSQLKSIGTVLGFTPAPYLEMINDKTLALTTAANFDGLLRHVLAGHLDAVYINVDVGSYLLTENLNAPNGLVFDAGLPHVRSDFSLSTRRHAHVIVEFDQFLRRQHALIDALRAKYGIGGNRALDAKRLAPSSK